ncbi:MAG: mechanosensitive ion channel [Methanotrichaceae archaeon]|nr:mechanosensitive ion channel [Methanotrichaceae archaeon]
MALLDQLAQWWTTISPHLVTALIVLIVGWLVALIVASLVRRGLDRTDLGTRLAGMVGEEKAKAVDANRWISRIVYYIILLFVLLAFFEILGLTVITDPINQLLTEVFAYAPRILGALVLALIGWILAIAAKKISLAALKAAKVDENLGSQTGIEQKQMSTSQNVAEAIYWLVLLLFLPMVLDALGIGGLLAPLQVMITKILAFLPNLFAAAIILIIGWFIARILRRIVTNLLIALGTERLSERVGISKVMGKEGLSGLIGLIVYILILIPVLLAALQALALEAITQPFSNMLNQILNAMPEIFGAALILAFFYILGKVIAEIVTNLLAAIGFNSILVRLNLGKEPKESERNPSEVVGYLVFVGVMLFALIEASQVLNFMLLADLITQFTVFAGHVVLGLIIFAIGIFLANLANKAVMTSGMAQAKILALAAQIAILVFAGAMALLQMGVANDIINLAFGLLMGAIAVAVALSFGLGGKEIAAREIEKWLQSIKSEKP